MEIPSELKPDLHKALLGPLSLADEIYGALLPGCLFLFLLFLKGNPIAIKAFELPLLGYKTKVACFLLIAYFVGKLSSAVVALSGEIFQRRKSGESSSKEWPSSFTTFVGGLVGGSMLSGKSPLFEYYAGFKAQLLFSFSLGLILVASACIPGDGNFRFAEFGAGLLFIIAGVRANRKEDELIAGILGASIGNALAGVPLEKLLSNATTILKLWPVVDAVVKAKGATPAQPASDPADDKPPAAT